MIDVFAPISAAASIDAPHDIHRPIGIVGAGAIMNVAHLPAYTSLGLPVVAITDADIDRARATAERFNIPRVHPNLDALLADDQIEIVDIAVPATVQPTIAEQVIKSGRHVLAQKPFAPDPATGQRLVDLAEASDTFLAVNQQLRFDEGIAAAHAMVQNGWIGEVSALTFWVDIVTPWTDWPWMLRTPRLEISNHSIHYHDAIRWFLGNPDAVFCAAGRRPGQEPAGETRTISTYLYESGTRALVHANHTNDHGDPRAEFRIDGTHGAIRGTLGLLYDYPHGRPDTLDVQSDVLPTDGWLSYPVTTRWIPDAFRGPITSVLQAIAVNSPLRSSGRDNIGTLRIVEALYTSINTKQAVSV